MSLLLLKHETAEAAHSSELRYPEGDRPRRPWSTGITRLGFSSFEIRAQAGSLPQRFHRLADRFEVDLDSLRAIGFYVVLRPDGGGVARATKAVGAPGRR